MATKNMTRLNVSLTATTGAFSRKIKSAAMQVRALAGSIKGLVAGYAAFRAVRFATTTIADFERAIATLRGVTRATTNEMAVMTTQARELGATTEHTATAAANAQLLLARAGFEVNEVFSSTPRVLEMATAAGIDMAESAQIVASTIRQYNLAADQSQRVTDVFVNTANNAKTTVLAMAEAFKMSGKAANTLDVSLEETAALIGVLGDNAIEGTMAGTNLRAIIASLSKLTPEAAKALGDLGLSARDMDIKTVGLTGALANLKTAGADTSDMISIFKRRNFVAAQVLVDNIGHVRQLTKENIAANGPTKKLAETMSDTLTGSFRGLKSAIEEAALSGGEAGLLGILRLITDQSTDFVRGLNKAETIPGIMSKVITAIGFVGDALQGIRFMYQAIKVSVLELAVKNYKAVNNMITIIRVFQTRFQQVWDVIKAGADLTWKAMKGGFDVVGDGIAQGLVWIVRQFALNVQLIGKMMKGSRIKEVAAVGLSAFKAGGILIEEAAKASKKLTTEQEKSSLAVIAAQVKMNNAMLALKKEIDRNQFNANDTKSGLLQMFNEEADILAADRRKQLFSDTLKADTAALSSALATNAQLEADAHQAKLDKMDKDNKDIEEKKKKGISVWNTAWKAGIEEQDEFNAKHWSAQAKDVAGALQSMTASVKDENKTMFAINKAASYATAVINTAEGVTKTLAKYPGPLGIAMAGVHAAAGAAQLAAISDTSYGGGGGGGGGTAAPVDSANTSVGASSGITAAAPARESKNLYLMGDTVSIERLVEQYDEAAERGYDIGRILRG